MPARKSPPERKPKASGANIEEWQRRGLKVQFRLSEAYADAIVRLAAKKKLPTNIVASRLVRDALTDLGLLPSPPQEH